MDLAEIGRALRRSDAVCGNSNDILVALIRRFIESQSRLARQHADLALLRDELPGQRIGDGGVESDLDAFGRGDGDDTARNVACIVWSVAVGADGLASPAGGLANLAVVSRES